MRHHPPHLRSLAVLPPLLLLLPSARGWSYTIEDAADVVCTGGAGFSKYGGEPNLRSGSPQGAGVYSSCRLVTPAAGPIRSVSLDFRYAAGYGCTPEACDNPAVMELWAVNDKGAAQPDTPLWKSQPLNQHSGDQGHWKEEAYSPAVAVSAECEQCVGQYLDFKWLNNGHNVQILLPITVSIDVVPWGFPTLAVVGLLAAGYVGGGLAYARRVQGSTVVGLAAHPHAERWAEVVALCQDGVSMVTGRGGGKGTGYRRVPDAPRDDPGERDRSAGGKTKGKSKREKSERKSRKEGKSGKGKGSKEGRAGAEAPAAADAAEPAPSPPPPKTGSAYRGDEWAAPKASVLSSGARETGVKVQL